MSLRARSVLAIALVLALSPRVHADETKDRCIASYDSAQKLRKATDLVGARAELALCANDACPDLARQDCVTWLREVDEVLPSLIVTVRDKAGSDLVAHATIDDRPLVLQTGAAQNVNPGEHVLRVEADGFLPHTDRIILSEREKARLVHIVLDPAPPPPPPPSHLWAWPFVAGGVALLSASIGIALDVSGTIDLQHLRTTCAPNCAPSSLDSVKTTIIAGDTLLYVGIASAIVATVLYFVRPRERSLAALRGTF